MANAKSGFVAAVRAMEQRESREKITRLLSHDDRRIIRHAYSNMADDLVLERWQRFIAGQNWAGQDG